MIIITCYHEHYSFDSFLVIALYEDSVCDLRRFLFDDNDPMRQSTRYIVTNISLCQKLKKLFDMFLIKTSLDSLFETCKRTLLDCHHYLTRLVHTCAL